MASQEVQNSILKAIFREHLLSFHKCFLAEMVQTHATWCMRKTGSQNLFSRSQNVFFMQNMKNYGVPAKTHASSEMENSPVGAVFGENKFGFTKNTNFLFVLGHTPWCMQKTYSEKHFSKPHYTDLSEKCETSRVLPKPMALPEVQHCTSHSQFSRPLFEFHKK